jgi:hypothetical protein
MRLSCFYYPSWQLEVGLLKQELVLLAQSAGQLLNGAQREYKRQQRPARQTLTAASSPRVVDTCSISASMLLSCAFRDDRL